MKYLICSGDSFTDDIFRSAQHPEMDTSWPKWPELLGEKLGMKVINVGASGKGNEYIYSSLHDVIESMEDKSEIGLVIAAWSQCHRRDYQTGGGKDGEGWKGDPTDTKGNIIGWTKRSLRIIKSLEYMCHYHDVPYIQTQMIPLFGDYLSGDADVDDLLDKYTGKIDNDYNTILNLLMKYEEIIDTSKFIGWPGDYKLGGFPLSYKVLGGDPSTVDVDQFKAGYVISPYDCHPNAAGQVRIAEYMYNRIKSV